ncbi:MAG: phosphotransferase [Proteobacteria bacterium]|nr:phosphotransferase [Pseudomonadota bacterium]MBI3497176.1 phosphotransferase [Pseudomonadota bacterium]
MTDDGEPAAGDIARIAQRLLGGPVDAVERIAGGGNNRLYLVSAGSTRFALKHYATRDGDARDRLGNEFNALRLVAPKLPGSVPQPVAADPDSGWAAYEWIEGWRLLTGSPADLDAMLDFVARLLPLRSDPLAQELPSASEACLSLAELIRQNHRRLARLRESPDPSLRQFLAGELEPLLEAFAARALRSYAAAGIDPDAELAPERRVLSPSDFGFHNMLLRPDGSRVFLDFEYFGWDDPAKLAADVTWHPAMCLPPEESRRFNDRMAALLAEDSEFPRRLAQFLPLIGIRWCLIVLNEFLPERWIRRRHAGGDGDWEAAKARQLAKARVLYTAIVAGYHPSQ